MDPTDPAYTTVRQTREPPLTELAAVRDHANAVGRVVSWDRVGVLMDEGPQATIVVLLAGANVVAAARFCLNAAESVDALRAYAMSPAAANGPFPTELRSWQGHTLARADASDLQRLTTVWQESAGQRREIDSEAWQTVYNDLERETKRKGRGKDISAKTRNQVLLDSHGRCMFAGCAVDLTIDPVTGASGNFGTLAHNVASSEGGARGVRYLSHAASDDPSNILLLCEMHHRLVDTVAAADFPAATLSAMRRRFTEDATAALDTLALKPIPAFGVAWPIHQQRIALPTSSEVQRALKPIHARLDGRLRRLSDNEAILDSLPEDLKWEAMAQAVESDSESILQQAATERYRAALFAIGLMPALIALGAKLGNKCDITPMLRYRETGLWYWPSNEPTGEFYSLQGLEELPRKAPDVCLVLGLTAIPPALRKTAETLGLNTVSIIATEARMGNGALAHPEDGASLRQRTQELLHQLRDAHGVRRVHVLPCVSNAASVFFGQAFDSYHPELLLYDFASDGNTMKPALKVANEGNACRVTSAGT